MNYLLIGRPNVGKSSIFNLLTYSNHNIVHPEEGTTRDWHKELIRNTGSFIFDTPGILIDERSNQSLFHQTFQNHLSKDFDSFLFVTEYNQGFNELDKHSINQLRSYGKNIILIVNKFDNYKQTPDNDFKKYGIDKIIFISCAHQYGITTLRSLFKIENEEYKKNIKNDFSLAIFGKPNAGKSTFLNTLVGYSRSLTSHISGTTSDYVIEYFNYKNQIIKIIDTAGIGKKSNIINKSINYLSVKKTFESIKKVDSAIIIIDANDGLDRQDKRIIKLISEKSKSTILIFNKIDLIQDKSSYKKNTILDIDASLREIKNIKIFFISALIKNNATKILDYLYNSIFLSNYKISTSNLNSWLKAVTIENQHPMVANKRINFKYAVQVKEKPVTIKIFCSYSNKLKNNYKRYLINNFNHHFKILNQKTKLIFSSSINPYI